MEGLQEHSSVQTHSRSTSCSYECLKRFKFGTQSQTVQIHPTQIEFINSKQRQNAFILAIFKFLILKSDSCVVLVLFCYIRFLSTYY